MRRSDDAAPATLGVTSCPNRSVPGGTVCGDLAIGSLTDVVACLECVSQFESTCTTALTARPGAPAGDVRRGALTPVFLTLAV